jgi:hypothetical protein
MSLAPTARRATRLLRVGLGLWLGCLGSLLAAEARGADIAVMATGQNIGRVRTLRVPATGTIAIDSLTGYVTVGIGLSDIGNQVSRVIMYVDNGQASSLVLRQTFRDADVDQLYCRSELWGNRVVTGSSAYLEITTTGITGTPPTPVVAATAVSYRNVASATILPPCCIDSANDGGTNSTINKTMVGSSQGDMLFNSVCTSWGGATPGMPTADPARDPEMMPWSFQSTTGPNLQHFTGLSPGADVLRPAVGSRHLRWLQTGSRSWAITGIILLATDAPNPPDAGPPDTTPVDMGSPSGTGGASGTGGSVGTGGVAGTGGSSATGGTAGPGAGGGTASPDAAGDGVPMPMTGGGGNGSTDTAARIPDGGGDVAVRGMNWQVGCACDLGRSDRDFGAVPFVGLLVWAAVLRRRA